MYSRAQLAEDFRALGIAPGDIVMVHASVRAAGPLAGGPDIIHLALKDVLTETGTLLMYTGCAEYVDDVGRGHFTPEQEREVLEKQPAYDPLTARSARDNGALVEFLRTYPGTRVNPHVTRFAAWGREVDYLFSEQPWHYAYGRGSALDRFNQLDGKILLLGCDHDTVTFLHHAEHIADIPDKRVARFQVPVLENGERVWREMEEFDSAAGAHVHWPERFFALITDSFIARERLSSGRVGDAVCYLLPAPALLAFAIKVMSAVAADRAAAAALRELPPESLS